MKALQNGRLRVSGDTGGGFGGEAGVRGGLDGVVDHGIPLTPFQLPANARLCRDRRGEGAARP